MHNDEFWDSVRKYVEVEGTNFPLVIVSLASNRHASITTNIHMIDYDLRQGELKINSLRQFVDEMMESSKELGDLIDALKAYVMRNEHKKI